MSRNIAFDVIVVGAGNAGLSAALAAKERGASVLVLEKAPEQFRGGNSSLTMNLRFPHDRVEELIELIDADDPRIEELKREYVPYPAHEMKSDLLRVSNGKAQIDLVTELVDHCRDTVAWLRKSGHRWEVKPCILKGALPIRIKGSGSALQKRHFENAAGAGVNIMYGESLKDFHVHDESHVEVFTESGLTLRAKSLILACGSYQASPELRRKYLGPEWEDVVLRGVKYNTGDGILLAEAHGLQLFGDYRHCHSTPQCSLLKQLSPGDNDLSQNNSRYCFQLGITVNKNGERFFDEHEDLPNFIYAKFGEAINRQEGKIAFQIFDSDSITKVSAGYFLTKNLYRSNTIVGLARSAGINADNLEAAIRDYNATLESDIKTWPHFSGENRPYPIAKAPFYIAPVKAGLTFCYGGLRTDNRMRVFKVTGERIKNVFAVGELAGGLHYHNYAGGTGMMFGSHFGRLAGIAAADSAVVPPEFAKTRD